MGEAGNYIFADVNALKKLNNSISIFYRKISLIIKWKKF